MVSGMLRSARERQHLAVFGAITVPPLLIKRLGAISEPTVPRMLRAVPRVRFHDMRYTHATLLLQEGEAVHTVSARLGHANAAITFGIYAHVTPSMQESAVSTIGRLLAGG
jgi:integrase